MTYKYQELILGLIITIYIHQANLRSYFCDFLSQKNLVKNKIVLDVGCSYFALGLISLKLGAIKAIGFDTNSSAIQCAAEDSR